MFCLASMHCERNIRSVDRKKVVSHNARLWQPPEHWECNRVSVIQALLLRRDTTQQRVLQSTRERRSIEFLVNKERAEGEGGKRVKKRVLFALNAYKVQTQGRIYISIIIKFIIKLLHVLQFFLIIMYCS